MGGNFTSQTMVRLSGLWENGLRKIIQGNAKLCALLHRDLPETWVETSTSQTAEGTEVQTNRRSRDAVIACIKRWSSASVSLLFQQYGRRLSSHEALANVESLVPEERDILERCTDPGVAIWAWHQRLLQRLASDGIVSTNHSDIAWDCLAGATFISQNVERQLPYQYVHMLAAVVKASNVFSVAVGGLQMGRALLAENDVEALVQLASKLLLPLFNNSALLLNINLWNPMAGHFSGWSEAQVLSELENAATDIDNVERHVPAELFSGKWVPSPSSRASFDG